MLDMTAIPTQVETAYAKMPEAAQNVLMQTREAIFEEAEALDGVGPLTETLKWGEPSYLTERPKTGTTLRLGMIGGDPALFVNCRTTIIEDAREIYGGVAEFSGTRGLVLGGDERATRHVIRAALVYHKKP